MQCKTTWIFVRASCLLLLCLDRTVLTKSVFNDSDQLWEGNRCTLMNGGEEGMCIKAVDCPGKMEEILTGSYSEAGRCGFSKFDEIVCCATGSPGKSMNMKMRPADTACEKYKKMVSELGDDTPVYAVVFNGVSAKVAEFPHMVALGYVASEGDEAIGGIKYICGGTLISEKHVLTAAHCVSNINQLVPVEVLLGTIDLTNPDRKGMQRIPISNIIAHPEYRRSLNYHDVAILELQKSAKISAYVQPTCLATKPTTTLFANDNPLLKVLGWGAIDLDGTTSTKLLKAEGLKFFDKNDCSKSYKNAMSKIPNGLDDGMICVVDADVTRKADTCWGDSGGPLLLSSPKFPLLVGITSFGQACGTGTPAVYASVYKYLDWIEDQVWPNSN